MDPSNIIFPIIIFFLIAGSAFFSSAETAFTTLNKIQLRTLVEEGNKKAIATDKLLQKSTSKLLSTILIGNNIVNIVVSSLTTTWALNTFGIGATSITTIILTIVLLIFGEITPKTLATQNNLKLALAFTPILNVLIVILSPVVFIIDKLAHFFLKLLRVNVDAPTTTITENELLTLVNVGHEEGVFQAQEKTLINNIFDFDDQYAKEIMVPRIDMESISIDATFEETMNLFRKSYHSRIPVYKGDNMDDIVGFLYSKDLLLSDSFQDPNKAHSFNIARLMRKPYFTFETQIISKLFRDMQKNKTSSAIVLDEYGAVAGMITTQDLIEEIVGTIHDEFDDIEDIPFKKIAEGKYKVDGSYRIDDLNDNLNTHLASDENDTIGGLIIEHLDRLPRAGDSIKSDGIKATVMKTSNNRIETVLIEVKN